MDASGKISVSEFFSSLSELSDEASYIVDYTTQFKKSVKLCFRRNLNLSLLKEVITVLAKGEELSKRYFPHPLKDFRKKGNDVVMECHIQPDWLLVWKQNDTELTLLLTDTGTHADLFGM